METRRLGRLGHLSSVLIYGGAALSNASQEDADRSIQSALDAGINHFDPRQITGTPSFAWGRGCPGSEIASSWPPRPGIETRRPPTRASCGRSSVFEWITWI
jgi:hypothetical protein